MPKQLVISISREYGSGGHEIAEKLAGLLELKLYDRNLLDEVVKSNNFKENRLEKYDEVPKRFFVSKTVKGFSNSPQEIVAQMQFDYMKEKVRNKESFIIVGRCSEEKLREAVDDDCIFIPIFIRADISKRIVRIMRLYNLNSTKAEEKIKRHDRNRKAYHNYFCSTRWGAASNYDITINSAKIGIEKTVKIIADYITERISETADI
mgnify:FL=1